MDWREIGIDTGDYGSKQRNVGLSYRQERIPFEGTVYWLYLMPPWYLSLPLYAVNISLSGILLQHRGRSNYYELLAGDVIVDLLLREDSDTSYMVKAKYVRSNMLKG